MTSALTYFITAFVITTNTPNSGWIQYTQAFDDRKACRHIGKQTKDSLTLEIAKHFGKKLVSIETFDCMTREEAMRRNTKIGH